MHPIILVVNPKDSLYTHIKRIICDGYLEAIKEGDVYTIDADACIDCGACEATCPNEAIAEA